MKRRIAAVSLLVAVIAFTALRAQTTQSTDAQRLAQTARDFGMTPEQLEDFVRGELGDPIIVDGDFIVGMRRDDDGHVKTISITTPTRTLEFNREPGEGRPGMQYACGDTSNAGITSVTDYDGDARVDLILFRAGHDAPPTILLRVENRFEPAKALGEGQFRLTASDRTVRFDPTRHEWVDR